MIHSFLIGLVAGARSLTPFAAVSIAANRGLLPRNSGAPSFLGAAPVAAGAGALALGEFLGDKQVWAPDRVSPPGLAARVLSGGLAGAALAPRGRRTQAVALGAAGAVLGGFLTFAGRVGAMGKVGQFRSGVVEDLITVASAAALVAAASRGR